MKGILALLCAALLHDVGHFPYAHALKDIIKPDHETIGASFIEEDKEVRGIIEENIGTRVEHVCMILDHSRVCDDKELLLYRSLLSGTLDPDKFRLFIERCCLLWCSLWGTRHFVYYLDNFHIDEWEISVSHSML